MADDVGDGRHDALVLQGFPFFTKFNRAAAPPHSDGGGVGLVVGW